MADRVSGHGFRYDCKVGFDEDERAILQPIQVDFEVRTDWRSSAQADRASNIVNYAEVDRQLSALLTGRSWRLIEAIAEAAAREICLGFPVDQTVKLSALCGDSYPYAHEFVTRESSSLR